MGRNRNRPPELDTDLAERIAVYLRSVAPVKVPHAQVCRLFDLPAGSSGRPGMPGSRYLSALVEVMWRAGHLIGTTGGLFYCRTAEEMASTLEDNRHRTACYTAKVTAIEAALARPRRLSR